MQLLRLLWALSAIGGLATRQDFATREAENLTARLDAVLDWKSPCVSSRGYPARTACPDTGCGCNKGCVCSSIFHACQSSGMLQDLDAITKEEGICRTSKWVYLTCAILVLAVPSAAVLSRLMGLWK
mmetsp:Transcript_76719/g.135338  ORF Transcript_76719/g.135338 Transcript_76719/m.135338 type:complete len:127 (+) Transcript_76719:33-413(+)